MSGLQGMEDLRRKFLTEAGALLAEVGDKLAELEKRPTDRRLLNDISRSLHIIKGGAGFFGVNPLAALCHDTESLFGQLRDRTAVLDTSLMKIILEATATVRAMFECLAATAEP